LAWAARRWAGFRINVSERQGVETLLAAYAAGVRYFDTAPYYGYGRSEHIFGQALRTLGRDSLVLSTKVGRWMSPKADNDDCRVGARVACRSNHPSTTAAKGRFDRLSSPFSDWA
jgi:aryl-alcohol dehydrogenase-like predicted oxidoreductase